MQRLYEIYLATATVMPGLFLILIFFLVASCITVRGKKRELQGEINRLQHKINQVMEVQEEERRHVSRELHDNIGQALYSIQVGLKILKNLKVERSMLEHMNEMEQLTASAMAEVKQMAVELRPSALDDLGLIPAIRSYAKKYEQTYGIGVALNVIGKHSRYSPKVELAVFRIVQESLTNAAKYSGASLVGIKLDFTADQLVVSIKDNGQGFVPEEQRLGLGLYNMKERAESVKGTLEVRSQPGMGTEVKARFPFVIK